MLVHTRDYCLFVTKLICIVLRILEYSNPYPVGSNSKSIMLSKKM